MNTHTPATAALLRSVNNAFGIVSIITPEVSFCFQSARLYARHTENEIVIVTNDCHTDLSIAVADIQCIEAMFCSDGTTEYEITTANSTITIDLESTGQEK